MEKQKIKDLNKLHKIIYDSKIKAIIFDFDGVITDLIIDYDTLKKELSRYCLIKYNFKNNFNPLNPNLELLKSQCGKKALIHAYRIIERHEIKNILQSRLNKKIANLIKLIRNNIPDKLEKTIVIFSMNMHKTIKLFLIKTKMLKYVDLIIAKNNVDKYKPDPEGLYLILNKLRLSQNSVIFIGNRNIDLTAGKAACIKTILI